MAETALAGYEAVAHELVPKFEAISSEEVLSPVRPLLPAAPARIVDIGAGTGRDAAWFSSQGHFVTAVEPVRVLRKAGMRLHDNVPINWVDDRLPDLSILYDRGQIFDRVILCAVWQHLSQPSHKSAMKALARLLAPGGLLILSLRHGPGHPDRPVFQTSPGEAIAVAVQAGLSLIYQCAAESVQATNRANGVTWTWLGFQ